MNSTLTSVVGEALWANINLHGPGSVRMHLVDGILRPLDYADRTYRRGRFLAEFAYAVPTPEAIQAIMDFLDGDALIEVGAGRALWTHLLQLAGATVVPTDRYTPKESGYEVFKHNDHTWTRVRHVEAKLAEELTTHGCLMTIWPPYGNAMAVDALRAFRGGKVVYVGEQYGCTATDAFHDELEQNWVEQKAVVIPQWYGVNDEVYFYVRKPNP